MMIELLHASPTELATLGLVLIAIYIFEPVFIEYDGTGLSESNVSARMMCLCLIQTRQIAVLAPDSHRAIQATGEPVYAYVARAMSQINPNVK